MGEIQKQGIRNIVISYFGAAIGFLNLLVVQPYFLSPSEIGLTRVLYSFSILLSTFFPLGLGNITTRFFPSFKDPESGHKGYFGFLVLYLIGGFILCCVLIYLFKDFLVHHYSEQAKEFTDFFNYVYLFTFFLGAITVLNTYCFSLYKTTFPTFLNDILVRVLSIALFSVYFLKLIDLNLLIFLFVGIYGLQLLILLGYIFSIDTPSFKLDRKYFSEIGFRKIVSYGIIISFASFSSLSLKYLDSVVLAKYVSLSLVGIYAIASFIPVIIEMPVSALEKIANARIAYAMATDNMQEVKNIYFKSVNIFLFAGGLLFLLVTLNIVELLRFLPDEYAIAAPVVIIISIASLFNMATGVNNAIIFNSKYYSYGTLLLYLLLIIAFANNLILIPRMGILGAAVATALSSLIYNVIKFFIILSRFRLQPYTVQSLKLITVIAVLYLIVYFIPLPFRTFVNILFRSAILVLLYTGITFILKAIPEKETLMSFLPFKKKLF